jgi:PAS domain S-box-containing protein
MNRVRYFFCGACFCFMCCGEKSFSQTRENAAGELLPGQETSWPWAIAVLLLLLVVGLLYYRVQVKTRDISTLKALNDKLEKEKYLLDFLMDNLPVLIYFKDKDSKFIRFTRHMADYFQKDAADIIGKSDFDFHDAVHAQEAFEDEQDIMRTFRSKINYLEKEVHQNGVEYWVSTTKIPLLDPQGNVIGTMGISKDVSEVKRQNKELLLREERIQAQNHQLLQQQEELAAQNEELIETQEEISAQRDVVADQNYKLQQASMIIEKQNEEIKQRNENLEREIEERTGELIEYNQQLEQFAYISAHNLRAPVARILGLGQLLELAPEDTKEKREVYEKLISTTRELDRVVRDLNTILEIRKRNMSAVTEIDLAEELLLVRGILEKEIADTQAEIVTDFSQARVIHTVKPYLDSILINLVSNAIKYRHEHRHPVVTLKTEVREDYVCLIVQDNGLGLDLSLFKDRIFTLYSRFHSHVEGKGMGLYLVKTQVGALGGKIEVESEVNKGITFYVYLRAHIQQEKTA